jgi:hypothetical protein
MENTKKYLLDTNSYYLFFEKEKSDALGNLISKLQEGDVISFYISEITSLEIISVLGKYRRGKQSQKQICGRRTTKDGVQAICSNEWITEGTKRMPSKVYRDMIKLINDIQSSKGNIKAEVLPLNENTIIQGKKFLYEYADKYKFGSQDAIIAGCLIDSISKGLDLTLVTSDKSLKAALAQAGIEFFDPKIIR